MSTAAMVENVALTDLARKVVEVEAQVARARERQAKLVAEEERRITAWLHGGKPKEAEIQRTRERQRECQRELEALETRQRLALETLRERIRQELDQRRRRVQEAEAAIERFEETGRREVLRHLARAVMALRRYVPGIGEITHEGAAAHALTILQARTSAYHGELVRLVADELKGRKWEDLDEDLAKLRAQFGKAQRAADVTAEALEASVLEDAQRAMRSAG